MRGIGTALLVATVVVTVSAGVGLNQERVGTSDEARISSEAVPDGSADQRARLVGAQASTEGELTPAAETREAAAQEGTSTTVVAVSEGEGSLTDGSLAFAEDFRSADSLARFDHGLYHRDDWVVYETSWSGDHSITGPDDLCGPPDQKRTIPRGDRETGFNDDWIYRCVPGGDPEKSHIMTSIGDTSGYSIGAFTPREVFQDVREIRWDVNLTALGPRQFIEVKVIPSGEFDFQNIPCGIEWLPCDTSVHGDLGSVGISFFKQEMSINNGAEIVAPFSGRWNDLRSDDPALYDVRERRTMIFADNNDGTLSYSIEMEDGTFQTITGDGSFPEGSARVVFADHNYTPEKDNDPIGFTWHWDNIEIEAGETGR